MGSGGRNRGARDGAYRSGQEGDGGADKMQGGGPFIAALREAKRGCIGCVNARCDSAVCHSLHGRALAPQW
jgi:hypothetical protein